MNAGPHTPAGQGTPGESWGLQRWVFLVALVFVAYAALLFLLGAKKHPVQRAVTNAPQFHLVDAGNEWVALANPTLFAWPNAYDLAPVGLMRPAGVTPLFRWTEPLPMLPPSAEALGMAFNAFMGTNRLASANLDFKPEPQATVPDVAIGPVLPQNSTLQATGELARRMLGTIAVPTLAHNDVIAPSKVQVLVEADGNVASVVLLASRGWNDADSNALAIARSARFALAGGLAFGELIFTWHTVPTTNDP